MAEAKTDDAVLDVVEEQIARTYAQGLLGAVGDQHDEAIADLRAIQEEILAVHPRLVSTLSSAFLDHEQRIAMIDRVLGGRVCGPVLNLLKVLSAHGRIGILPAVVRQAIKLDDAAHNRVEVVVRLAHEPDQGIVSDIANTLRDKLGFEPVLRVVIDPDLIGGLEIRVGDTVYDGTLRTAFKKSHAAIVEQTIHAIESQPERFTATSAS